MHVYGACILSYTQHESWENCIITIHIRIMPSVCLIELTASIVTYGCPSFEWFWQSGDNSNVCSTHPYTQTSLYCVECLCVHFVQVLYDTVSVTGLPFFCSPLMCARKHHLLLWTTLYTTSDLPTPTHRKDFIFHLCVSTSYKFCMLLSSASFSTTTRQAF